MGALAGYFFFYARTPPAPATPATTPVVNSTAARFRSIEGNVKVKPVGTFEWVPADANMVLRKSDLVRTGAGSAAEISFVDGTIVHVRPDSLITIEETSEDPSTKRRRVAWHISSGEVNFQTVRRNVAGSSTEVSTPTVKATAGELAQGGIKVAEGGDTPELLGQMVDMALDLREEARKRKDFATADQIRKRLADMGIEVEDGPKGPTWKRRV